ncbi:MAG TPA: DUF2304 family protein [Candidatus Nanoarchaeia archaeon]|nr:DUF2304 family protein [Candidatus Nanoarchaeia archaeon]
MIEPVQIVAGIVMLIGIMRAILLFRSRKLTLPWFVFWVIVWGGVGIVAFLPAVSYWLAHLVGISRGLDLLVYLSIVTLFYLVFKLFMKFETLSREITSLVRELALRKK